MKKNGLFGFNVDEAGRLIDPVQDPRYTKTGQYLKLQFGLPANADVLIFDVTDHPSTRLGYLTMSAAMIFTIVLAMVGLRRRLRR
jgi:hypothetical protein